MFVPEGTPDLWLDGVLHRLRPGDAVGFPAGMGQAHTFINDTDAEVRLLVVGEATRPDNRIVYPLHPERRGLLDYWWTDAPTRELAPTTACRPRRARRSGGRRPPATKSWAWAAWDHPRLARPA